MTRDLLLAASLVLASASQLRIPGLPAGPGELLLASWLCWSALRLLVETRPVRSAALLRMAAFWAAFVLALSVGACVGLLTEASPDTHGLVHDSLAYLLMIALTCLALVERDAQQRLRRTAWLVVATANAALLLQLAMGLGWLRLPSVDPWYWDRLRGWSENPNQLALYCAALGPLALHLAMTSARRSHQVLGALGAVLPLVAGRLTKSDTFVVATAVTYAVLIALRLRAWLSPAEGRAGLRYALAVGLVVLGPPLAVSLVPFGLAASESVQNFAKGLAKDKGGDATARTASLRLYLWEQALRRGLESGSLGLGPGPHIDRPFAATREGIPMPFEAHSTLLDLYTQGGLPAVLCLVGLAAGSARLVLRSRLDALVALIAALAVFSISHFILRHPIVWFALMFCLAAGCGGPRPAPVGHRS